jgi:hypothetical protein
VAGCIIALTDSVVPVAAEIRVPAVWVCLAADYAPRQITAMAGDPLKRNANGVRVSGQPWLCTFTPHPLFVA